jgi:hypothetical protein
MLQLSTRCPLETACNAANSLRALANEVRWWICGSDRLVAVAATHAGTRPFVRLHARCALTGWSGTVHRYYTHLRLRVARCGAALMGDTDARPEEL